MKTARIARIVLFTTLLGSTALAQDAILMNGVEPRPENNSVVEAGAFQKDGPWTIAMSHFGVNANTWTVQTAHEAQGVADADPGSRTSSCSMQTSTRPSRSPISRT